MERLIHHTQGLDYVADVVIYVTLVGKNIDHSAVDQAMGIPASNIRRRTEKLGNGRLFGHDEWTYQTDVVKTTDIDEVFKVTLSRLWPRSSLMKTMAHELDAEWNILVYIKDIGHGLPSLVIPSDAIQFAASIEAAIGFDIYPA